MNDRFKFRAYITCIINRDTEEEKEVSFYINDVAVYRYGDIGFSRDQLLEALSKLDLTEAQKDEIEEDISENSYCEDYDWYSIEFGTKEQCTGLGDMDKTPVFEGDILKSKYSDIMKYKVVWKDGRFVLKVYGSTGICDEMPLPTTLRDYLGIGNIHENADLLEV